MTVAIAYGDSLTAQVWPDIQAWPQRYASRLAGETSGAVLNRGLGGQRMHHCRGQAAVPGVEWPAGERWVPDDLAMLEAGGLTLPPVVIVAYGVNDIPIEATPDGEFDDLLAAWEVMDETLRNRWGIALHVLSVPPMRVQGIVSAATRAVREPRRRELNQRLRTLFDPSGRYHHLGGLEQADGQTRPECAHPDGLHLSAWGQVVIADTLPLTMEAGRG